MPQLNSYIVTATVQFEVRGNDYPSVAKLAADQLQPALEPPRGGDIPYISSVPRMAGIEISMPH